MVNSIPTDKVTQLLDELFQAFNGAGYDLGSLLDSWSKVLPTPMTPPTTPARCWTTRPVLDSQVQSSDAMRLGRTSGRFTDQLVTDDSQFRTLLETGPGFTHEVSRLLTQLKPTLPVLLANLTTIGQIGVTYHPALEQLLVLLPPCVSASGSYGLTNNPIGLAWAAYPDYLRPAGLHRWIPPALAMAGPADTREMDTPDGLYCKLPQRFPISVRGARNYPCMGHPGKRAPTVESATATNPTNRLRSVSTCWARIPWIQT